MDGASEAIQMSVLLSTINQHTLDAITIKIKLKSSRLCKKMGGSLKHYRLKQKICFNEWYLIKEIFSIVEEFSSNGYSNHYVCKTSSKKKKINGNNKSKKVKGCLVIPYIKNNALEKIRSLAAKYTPKKLLRTSCAI